MSYGFLDIAITPSVRAAQEEMGVAHLWEDFRGDRASDRFSRSEEAFIAQRDSFYIASVSETGWPYVQHAAGRAVFSKSSTSAPSPSPITAATGSTSAPAMSPPTAAPACS